MVELPADSLPRTNVKGGDVWVGGEASAFLAVARNALSEGLVAAIVSFRLDVFSVEACWRCLIKGAEETTSNIRGGCHPSEVNKKRCSPTS